MMNGIDIAGFQKGIDLTKVPGDFVIIKATQNKSFVNSAMTEQIASAQKAGKLIGLYHYAGGAGAETEAKHFIKTVSKYIGKAILVLDWEKGQNSAFGNENYAKQWLDYVKEQTGVTPLIYMSQSVCASFAHTDGIAEYPLWVAQYGSMAKQYGYDQTPWKHGSVTPWKKESIRQYSSTGRLDGWPYVLDLDLAYISKADWKAMAAKDQQEQEAKIVKVETVNGKTYKVTYKRTGKVYTVRDISYGMEGEDVRLMQQLLNAAFRMAGHSEWVIKEDGKCGEGTLKAIARFQLMHKGIAAGKGTWNELMKL